jgi:hypothetical protein
MKRKVDQAAMPRWVAPAMLAVAVVVLIGTATPPGAQLVAGIQGFLAKFAGVLALVGFSVAVMLGLLATERTMLGIRHRVLAQAVHHAVALLATAALVAHIFVKILTGHSRPQDAVVPFLSAKGLGTLASDLFIFVLITGLIRVRWAAAKKPGQWRALHVIAYVAWPISILHGLVAGRAPTGLGVGPLGPWVTVLYIVCMVGVALALVTRMFLLPRQGEPERMVPEPELRIEMPPMAAPAAAAQGEREQDRTNQAFWGPVK